jgi:hypothetical protein
MGWVGLLLDHEGGKASEASLRASTAAQPRLASRRRGVRADRSPSGRTEFADTVRRGGGHQLDVHRGLDLQQLIEEAEQQKRVSFYEFLNGFRGW